MARHQHGHRPDPPPHQLPESHERWVYPASDIGPLTLSQETTSAGPWMAEGSDFGCPAHTLHRCRERALRYYLLVDDLFGGNLRIPCIGFHLDIDRSCAKHSTRSEQAEQYTENASSQSTYGLLNMAEDNMTSMLTCFEVHARKNQGLHIPHMRGNLLVKPPLKDVSNGALALSPACRLTKRTVHDVLLFTPLCKGETLF